MAPQGSKSAPWTIIIFASFAGFLFGGIASILMGLPLSGSAPAATLPRKSTTFNEDKLLEDLTPANNKAWQNTLLTPKGGFMWVQESETEKVAWGISMFHSLHCLQMIRSAIQQSPVGEALIGHNQTEHMVLDPDHIGHCIRYIAQVSTNGMRETTLF